MLQYLPSGEEFVCVNGKNRYTRALYGGHTAWRLETGDRPIFATYVKNDCRNIRFRLHLPDGTVTPLEETDWCEARYNPGTRTYALKDKAWGENCSLKVSVLASLTEEMAVWELSGELPAGCELEVLNSPICRKKLSRSGDMGADPPGCFEPAEDGTVLQTLKCRFPADRHLYVGISGNELKEMQDGGVQYLALQRLAVNWPDASESLLPILISIRLAVHLLLLPTVFGGKRACGCMELSAGVCR